MGMQRIGQGQRVHRTTFLLGVWLVGLLLWGTYLLGWRTNSAPEAHPMSEEFSFTLATGTGVSEIFPIQDETSRALVFVDPECEVCVSQADHIERILEGFRHAERIVIPLAPFEGEGVRELFREQRLAQPLDSEQRALSGVTFVPAFIYLRDGEERLRFQGMPGPAQAIAWRFRSW